MDIWDLWSTLQRESSKSHRLRTWTPRMTHNQFSTKLGRHFWPESMKDRLNKMRRLSEVEALKLWRNPRRLHLTWTWKRSCSDSKSLTTSLSQTTLRKRILLRRKLNKRKRRKRWSRRRLMLNCQQFSKSTANSLMLASGRLMASMKTLTQSSPTMSEHPATYLLKPFGSSDCALSQAIHLLGFALVSWQISCKNWSKPVPDRN